LILKCINIEQKRDEMTGFDVISVTLVQGFSFGIQPQVCLGMCYSNYMQYCSYMVEI